MRRVFDEWIEDGLFKRMMGLRSEIRGGFSEFRDAQRIFIYQGL